MSNNNRSFSLPYSIIQNWLDNRHSWSWKWGTVEHCVFTYCFHPNQSTKLRQFNRNVQQSTAHLKSILTLENWPPWENPIISNPAFNSLIPANLWQTCDTCHIIFHQASAPNAHLSTDFWTILPDHSHSQRSCSWHPLHHSQIQCCIRKLLCKQPQYLSPAASRIWAPRCNHGQCKFLMSCTLASSDNPWPLFSFWYYCGLRSMRILYPR